MAKQKEKITAQKLRREGQSIGSISKKLQVSKSTVSDWCKDIALTELQIAQIAVGSKHHATAALLQAAEKKRSERKKIVSATQKEGQRQVGPLSKRDIFMIGLGLYWGEGYKKGSQELGFTNSDPAMIKFYLLWLYELDHISLDRLILRVSINMSHQDREREVLHYWSRLLQIPLSQFTKTSFIKAKSMKQVYTDKHYGTLRVKVRRGTMLRHQILGSIEQIKKHQTQ